MEMPDGSTQRLWTKNPPAVDPTRYNLTSWAIKLNELTPGLKERLAPTDCRLRPDQAYLERGMHDEVWEMLHVFLRGAFLLVTCAGQCGKAAPGGEAACCAAGGRAW